MITKLTIGPQDLRNMSREGKYETYFRLAAETGYITKTRELF